MLRGVQSVTEGMQRGDVGVSEDCSLGPRHIKPREICAASLHCLFPMSPHLAFFICLSTRPSISPSIHPAAHPSTLPASQPCSRLALTVSILKSQALPCLAYFQLLCSTAFSTPFSSLTPTWLQSLERCFTSPSLSFSIYKNGAMTGPALQSHEEKAATWARGKYAVTQL